VAEGRSDWEESAKYGIGVGGTEMGQWRVLGREVVVVVEGGCSIKRPTSKGHARESAAGCLAIWYLETKYSRSSHLMAGGDNSVRRYGR